VAVVVLLRGMPGNGKSFCSIVQKAWGKVDAVLHTDELYVGYIYTRRPDIYVHNLRQQIYPHYNRFILSVRDGWHEFLAEVVRRDAGRVRSLLIEGWNLNDCSEPLTRTLHDDGHTVFNFIASGMRYTLAEAASLSVEQMRDWLSANLTGTPTDPAPSNNRDRS
jgi:hypothetical protein